MRRGKLVAAVVLAALFGAAPTATQAQSPGGVVRIIIPFAPAGSADVLARLLQAPLHEELQQTVIVENHAGAGSNIGTSEGSRAKPDCRTLLITTSAFVVNPSLYASINYDYSK